MRLVREHRPCPRCMAWSWYTEVSVYRGRGKGAPGMQWAMEKCGHSFATPEFARWGEGWVRVDLDSLDAQPCE